MSKGLEALEKLKNIAIYEENKNNCSDLGSCCDYCGDLDEVYDKEINAIEKELKALEILKKHIRIAKPFDLETKEEEPFEIFDIDLWNDGKQKEDFEFVKEALDL